MTNVDEYGGWTTILKELLAGDDLSEQKAFDIMTDVLNGDATPVEVAGLLVAMRAKGETVSEMTGMARAMMEVAQPLVVPEAAIDIVGTGGSHLRLRHALNVSTMASLVAAAAGAVVCKHGNLKATSTSGSFDFLDALGVRYDLDGAALSKCVSEVGVGFAFARRFHPAMRHVAPIRAGLGIPTVFNLLGPLVNPGRLRRQVIGAASEEIGRKMAEVLHSQECERAWVVTGGGGLDELTSISPTSVFDIQPSGVERFVVNPGEVGLTAGGDESDLVGGTAADNVKILQSILDGSERGPRYEMVVLNAAAGLVVGGVVDDLESGVGRAKSAIENGVVLAKVEQVVAFTNSVA